MPFRDILRHEKRHAGFAPHLDHAQSSSVVHEGRLVRVADGLENP